MAYKIYIISDSKSSKKYIGKTRFSLEKRLSQHRLAAKRGSKTAIHRALNARPEDFSISSLRECIDNENANSAEKELILSMNTMLPHGYNVTPGGDGVSVWSDRMKDAARERHKKQFSNKEMRDRASIKSKEAWKNPKIRAKYVAASQRIPEEIRIRSTSVLLMGRERLKEPAIKMKRLLALWNALKDRHFIRTMDNHKHITGARFWG